MRSDIRVGHSAWSLGVQDVINNVQNTICDQDIWVDELRTVDVYVVSGVEDGNVLALLGEEFGAIGETGREHFLRQNVVIEDRGQFFNCH